MNRIISDTAEYGCYLFDHACKPLLGDFFKNVNKNLIAEKFTEPNQIDNKELIKINRLIRNHPIEKVGKKLRKSMIIMKNI
jgi:ketol-acid reductoisomerase